MEQAKPQPIMKTRELKQRALLRLPPRGDGSTLETNSQTTGNQYIPLHHRTRGKQPNPDKRNPESMFKG